MQTSAHLTTKQNQNTKTSQIQVTKTIIKIQHTKTTTKNA